MAIKAKTDYTTIEYTDFTAQPSGLSEEEAGHFLEQYYLY